MVKHLTFLLAMVIPALAAHSQQKVLIYFDYNKANITPVSKQTLDSLLQNKAAISPDSGIEITAHCDARGSDASNISLSESRLNAVRNYLTNGGVAETLIKSARAYGERQPLNSNETEAEMALNRRVEIIFEKAQPVTIVEKPQNKTLADQIKDTSVKVGGKLILRNLNFEGGRHVLLPYSVPILEELLNTLKNSPTLKIAIEGHVCCAQGTVDGLDIDTKTYNLSVNRAKVVYDYLVKNGIEPERLSWDGYGNKYPIISPEYTEDDRTTNRRVEIKILQK